ncbi:MAG: site-specific tyrosine recombinase XerD [Clostridiales bacterium]|nr:MAG: site-specific tyrosine recombinase XerD [Clostridiales bacterium]
MERTYMNFCNYLMTKKSTSANTLSSYQRDLRQLMIYLQTKNITAWTDVSDEDLRQYFASLKKAKKSDATISRSMSTMRCFFKYLVSKKIMPANPMAGIRGLKAEARLPEVLTSEEVELLLWQPDILTVKGIRDKAMLEVLYASGIRASELLSLKLTDVNLDVGYLMMNHHEEKERIVPLYSLAVQALRNYLAESRPQLTKSAKENTLFLNTNGQPMTRQGFWKLVKYYTAAAKIEKDITPKTLRHSFAAHLLENGADINMVKDMMGHSSITSTKVYAKLLKTKYLSTYEHCHPRAVKAGE